MADKGKDARPIRMKTSTKRGIVAGAVFAVVVAGALWHTGTGTFSSFGWDFIATICPLGALEALLGSWAFVPRLLLVLAATIVIVLVVGSSFCSWACPVPHISSFFKTKKVKEAEKAERAEASKLSLSRYKAGGDVKRPKVQLDTRHGVLAGVLLSTAVFGFPVFCLVCPVGITCGIVVLLVRLVGYGELTWGLLAFPVLLVLELTVFRRWCGKICPISALFSLISSFNKTLRPKVDGAVCLRGKEAGGDCRACSQACPQLIDPHSDLGPASKAECTRCGSCKDACPVHAISFPFLEK